jgi:Tfp pilus assembly protein PilF
MPEDLKLATPQKQEEVEQKLLSHLCQGPGAIIVIDEFQYLLAGRDLEDPSIRRFFVSLLCGSRDSKTKVFLISHVAPQLGSDIESRCSFYTLQGLSPRDTERLLLYWFQFGREDLLGHFPSPSDRFLSLLGGHPLATRVAGRLWAEHPSEDISQDLTIFQRLRDTIVSFVLEKITLTIPETEFLSFASVFRLPVSREAFLRWRGEEASNMLNALTGQYLVESSERGYELHPLVRDFFYNKLSTSDAAPLHKIAGKFYMDQFEKFRSANKQLVPEYLGEAVHHYLASGERTRVQSVAFYKQELKPVALLHYRKGDYKVAQKDYVVLVQLDESDVDAHFHLALINARNNKWEEAELHFGKAIKLRPKAPWILQGFANAKIRAGKLAEAEQLLQESEEANPYHSPTLAEFGRLRERQGDSAGAEDYYRRAIQADPDNAYAYYMLASLLYREGDLTEAYEMAKGALAAKPLDDRNKDLVKELRRKVEEVKQPDR